VSWLRSVVGMAGLTSASHCTESAPSNILFEVIRFYTMKIFIAVAISTRGGSGS